MPVLQLLNKYTCLTIIQGNSDMTQIYMYVKEKTTELALEYAQNTPI